MCPSELIGEYSFLKTSLERPSDKGSGGEENANIPPRTHLCFTFLARLLNVSLIAGLDYVEMIFVQRLFIKSSLPFPRLLLHSDLPGSNPCKVETEQGGE